MAFARLAPHCGLTPVYGLRVGNSDMRGGFSWSSLGNSLSSGLSRIGSFVSNAAQKIGNSQTFQQAKSGLLQSGVVENAGQLAGQALSGLLDVGRLKLENDLYKLRQKALGESPSHPPLTADQLVQLLAVSNSATKPVTLAQAPPSDQTTPNTAMDSTLISSVTEPPPDTEPIDSVLGRRSRKRRRVSGWGEALNGMLGDGVKFDTRKYCY